MVQSKVRVEGSVFRCALRSLRSGGGGGGRVLVEEKRVLEGKMRMRVEAGWVVEVLVGEIVRDPTRSEAGTERILVEPMMWRSCCGLQERS